MAATLFRHHLRRAGAGSRFKVSSAGTKTSRPGARPDQRAIRVLAAEGIPTGRAGARRVAEKDLVRSDFIFVMERSHLSELCRICPPYHQKKLSLLLPCQPGGPEAEVPDPYYGSYASFQLVFKILDEAMPRLVSIVIGSQENRDLV